MTAEDELKKSKKFSNMVRRANDKSLLVEVHRTNLPFLDLALNGGFTRGRSVEVFGESGTAKTVLAYLFLVSMQKKNGLAALIDPERAFDPEWFQSLGGDPNELLYFDGTTVEEIIEFIKEVCDAIVVGNKKEGIDRHCGIAWDSIALSTTKHLLEEGMDKRDMSFAGALTAGCKYITGPLSAAKAILFATNHCRDIISTDPSAKYAGTHTPGGKMYKYAVSTRIELKYDGGAASSQIKEDGAEKDAPMIGRFLRGIVIKSRCGAVGNNFKFPIYTKAGYEHPIFGEPTKLGIDLDEALLDLYLDGKYKINGEPVVQSGAWCKLHASFGNTRPFRKADWKNVLAEFSQLRDLPYSNLSSTIEEGAAVEIEG